MTAPYFVKLEVTIFIKKLNFIHQGFLPQFKKSFIPENFFSFFLKEKKKRKPFASGQDVFPLKSIEAWNWSNADVSEKQTDCLLLI